MKSISYVCVSWVDRSCLALCDPMDCRPQGSSIHGDSPGKNTEMGCLALLLGIFPTQGSNPGLPHWRRILYCLSHQGSPRILEWVAYPSPGELLNPGIEPGSPAMQADSLPAELPGKPRSAICVYTYISPPSWISLSPPPFHPLRSSQSTKLNSLCNILKNTLSSFIYSEF